jgi:iron(III) transport system ATP-binding protein
MTEVLEGTTSRCPAARVRGVSKFYGGVRAVNDVTFDVASGELLTLLGPSGCGKTTIMRSIAGLERITHGEILLRDRVVSSASERIHIAPEKRDVGMVFQSYAIWPHMSVFENVAYPLRCRKVAKAEIESRVRHGLRLVEMEDFHARPATMLSGGQQQRVALARSMVMQPSVLLLDEPLCNLDAKLRAQMRSHIKDLQRKTGLTMIYVTHDQVEAMALSDRIIVMNRGVIEQVGVPEEVYERPQSEFVADFVGAINFFPGTIIEDGGTSGTIRVSTGSEVLACTLDGRISPVMGDRVLLMIRPEKLTVDDGTGRAPGLHQDCSAPVNTVRARVSSHTYCGDHCELGFEGRDFALKAMLPSAISPEVGQEAVIAFSARDLHLLPSANGVAPRERADVSLTEA